MRLSLAPALFMSVCIATTSVAQDGSESGIVGDEDTLAAAKESYEQSVSEARRSVLEALNRKKQKIESEVIAFENNGVLPDSVKTNSYESRMRLARVRLERAYRSSAREYKEKAKTAQAELEQFVDGKYYKVFRDSLSWNEASILCKKYGGRLAVITSRSENQHVYSLAAKLGLDSVWLGASDEQQEGTWRRNTGEKLTYRNWGPQQPNNRNGNEHFLLMTIFYRNSDDYVGTWTDAPTRALLHKPGFVCQWEVADR